jgi:L-serine dehydratase
MAFSSVRDMVELCKETGQPLYEVILESDLTESGLTRAESEAEMHRLWSVMCATSAGYCSTDRSMSGFAGGDAAKVSEAAARGILYADGYFADVMAEALKTAECNACMKRIVAAPTAGSCGVLPAVLLPLWRRGLADETAIHRALYIAAGFGQVVAARATLAAQRQKIADETFSKAREQLAAFVAGKDYAAWLQKEAASLAETLGENAKITARAADLPLLKNVRLPAGTVLEADDSITLGGLKGANPAKGVAADDTLEARLEAQHDWFLENAGLEINI